MKTASEVARGYHCLDILGSYKPVVNIEESITACVASGNSASSSLRFTAIFAAKHDADTPKVMRFIR